MTQIDTILSRLTPILQDSLENDDIAATPALTAADVEGWDSLAHVRLMLAVQRSFQIRFTAAEINGFKNVGELARAIAAKTAH